MARVAIQQGHCFRTRGATGTRDEQRFVSALAPRIADRLRAHGHVVAVLTADEAVTPCDVFVALHTDGSTDPGRRGASVGYPDEMGGRLAAAWKRAHQRAGYSAGFLPDNYTAALRGYYGFGRAWPAPFRFLAEHGTTTNDADHHWLFAHLDACADAHVAAIGEVVGHPDEGDDDMAWTPDDSARLESAKNYLAHLGDNLVPRVIELLERIADSLPPKD